MKILEAEINLREETRVAEQARAGVTVEEHQQRADALAETQYALGMRMDDVIQRILALPDAEAHFAKDLALLRRVVPVLAEAREILAAHDTGSTAIAAETEAIELLLQSKRINPNGGGGDGANPGGGGGGTTTDSAIALLGASRNTQETREETGTGQTTGTGGAKLPAEWRAGIDEYFNRLESKRARIQ